VPQKTLWEKATVLRGESRTTKRCVWEELDGVERWSLGVCRRVWILAVGGTVLVSLHRLGSILVRPRQGLVPGLVLGLLESV
jgi:hypothetical protein